MLKIHNQIQLSLKKDRLQIHETTLKYDTKFIKHSLQFSLQIIV